MQPFSQTLVARSVAPGSSVSRQPSLANRQVLATTSTVAAPRTPFQAALAFISHKQHQALIPAAYVAFLVGDQLLAIDWLHNQRGHNPAINLDKAIRKAKQYGATQLILATWVGSSEEYPYDVEFQQEVDWQHEKLTGHGLHLVDNLRLSETGVYSYYGDHAGPYSDAPSFHERSINRYYAYGR